jgi:Catalase
LRSSKILRNTLVAGPGGATHQTADAAQASLTTNQGVVVADNQNTLKSGVRGPSLLEDFAFREKITHFDHERIPERIVQARGSGAHGYFEVTNPIPQSDAGVVPRRERQENGSLCSILPRRGGRGRGRPAVCELPRACPSAGTVGHTKLAKPRVARSLILEPRLPSLVVVAAAKPGSEAMARSKVIAWISLGGIFEPPSGVLGRHLDGSVRANSGAARGCASFRP